MLHLQYCHLAPTTYVEGIGELTEIGLTIAGHASSFNEVLRTGSQSKRGNRILIDPCRIHQLSYLDLDNALADQPRRLLPVIRVGANHRLVREPVEDLNAILEPSQREGSGSDR